MGTWPQDVAPGPQLCGGARGNGRKKGNGPPRYGNSNGRAPSYSNSNDPRAVPQTAPPGGRYPTGTYGDLHTPQQSVYGYPQLQYVTGYITGPAPLNPYTGMPDGQLTMPGAPSVINITNNGVAASDAPIAPAADREKAVDPPEPEAAEGGTYAHGSIFIPLEPSKLVSKRTVAPNNIVSLDLATPCRDKNFAPSQGKVWPIDLPHATSEATVALLEQEALYPLQHLDPSSDASLRQTLGEARTRYHNKEAEFAERRMNILTELKTGHDQELLLDKNMERMRNSLLHNLSESFKHIGPEKEAAQKRAITVMTQMTRETRLTTENHKKLNGVRMALTDLDSERVLSANAFADAVHGVVVQALGSGGTLEGATIVQKEARNVGAVRFTKIKDAQTVQPGTYGPIESPRRPKDSFDDTTNNHAHVKTSTDTTVLVEHKDKGKGKEAVAKDQVDISTTTNGVNSTQNTSEVGALENGASKPDVSRNKPPKADVLKIETSKSDPSKTNSSKTDTSKTDNSKPNTSKTDTPKPNTSTGNENLPPTANPLNGPKRRMWHNKKKKNNNTVLNNTANCESSRAGSTQPFPVGETRKGG